MRSVLPPLAFNIHRKHSIVVVINFIEEWDVCVPDDQLNGACQLFETTPLNARFERVHPPDPMPLSLRHRFPTFKLKGIIFYFLLTTSSDCLCDPRPEFCERSQMGIPYPQDIYFARSLLARQDGADLEDFVDAHNSSVEWGESNLDFPDLQAEGAKYAIRKNGQITSDGRFHVLLQVDRDFAAEWRRVVEGKEGRIEPLKQGRYITRWRSKARPVDPRLPDPKGRNKFRDHV